MATKEFLKPFILIAFLAFLPIFISTTTTNYNRRQLPRLLIAPEFKLETKVKIIREKFGGIDEETNLTEYYSNEQQKVNLHFNDLEESVDYYYDTSLFSERQLIKVTSSSQPKHITNCEIVDFKKFAYQLFGALSSYDERLTGQDWLRERDDVPDYVIGLARLLYIIESNRDKLIPDGVQGSPTIIRNHETIKYKLEENQSVMRVFYPKESDLKSDLPLRVLLTLPKGSEIMVDYLAMKQLKESKILEQPDYEHDQFTYPINERCLNKLKPSSIFSKDHFLAPKVFSFEAEIVEMGHNFNYQNSDGIGSLGEYFIAYDGHVKVLRIDSKVSSYSSNEEEYSTSIYVPKRNRKFNVRSTLINSDEQQRQQETLWDCVSSKISVDGQIQHSFAEPLIPFDKLVHVGRGQVRGVECIVYAAIELVELPKIFFPQVSYYDGGKARLVQDNTKRSSLKAGEKQYLSVYYFSLQQDHGNTIFSIGKEQKLGPLMRIDLHERDEGVIAFGIEVFNFAWILTDAPNGDRRDELFSLYEKCSNINNKIEDKYAQLTMSLEFTSEISEPTNEPVSVESLNKAIKLFESPDVRNLALIRAISINSNLLVTQISEFRSHLRPLMLELNPKLFIRIEAKLSNQVYDLYEAEKVGNGILEESLDIISFAKSFDECYWEAAHRRKYRAHILFSFCYSNCIINENSYHVDSSSANKKAGFFAVEENENFIHFDENSTCEILRMDLKKRDIPADNIISKFWTTFHHSLRGLKLPVFVYDQQEDRVSFLVDKIDVYNNKWLNLQREPIFKISSSDRSNDVLKGLALSLADVSTKKVKLRKVWNQFERNDSSRYYRMNFDLCHSSCMANMTCRSYSVCYDRNQVHCLISDLEFKSAELFGRISKKIEVLKLSNKSKGPIKVDFNSRIKDSGKNKSADEDETSSIETHELWIDNKCQTYNKYALEMFIQSKVVLAKLKNKYVVPVESEDECAELCLKQNVNFFKRTASFKLKYLESQGMSNENYLSEMLEKQNSEIRSWCSGFRFLNLATSTIPDEIRYILRPSKLRSNGLCSLVGPDWILNQRDNDEKKELDNLDRTWDKNHNFSHVEQLVTMQSYELLYSMLYERHHGIKLIKNYVSERENNYLIDAQLSSNNQIILDKQNDIESCARACFSQTIGLKPWCKSFEFIEDKSDIISTSIFKSGKAKEKVKSYCVFNSLSFDDILQMKSPELFVDTDTRPDLTVWHFELRNSYTLNDLIASRLIVTENLDFYNENKSQFRLETLSITIVLLMSIVSGLCCGLSIGYKLIDGNEISGGRRESIENPSRYFLNSLISGISGNPNEISHRRFEPDLDLPDLALEVCDTRKP